MEVRSSEIANILSNNLLDNIICRALETRPGELAKYICGLANTEGGYVFVGVERENGILNCVGFQTAFDMNLIMDSVVKKIVGEYVCRHGYISFLGKAVFVIQVEKAEQRILVENDYYRYVNNNVEVIDVNKLKGTSTLFISYTECDTPIVDIIEDRIHKKLGDKILVSRYTGLKYKESFKAFMDTIQDHDFVLTVVSDTYLKRQPCMYEVSETLKDHRFRNKLLFVVLSEKERKYYGDNAPEKIAPNIYGGAASRLEYTQFWQKKHDELNTLMKQIDDYEATRQAAQDLQIIGQIYRKDLGEFLQFLSDENGKSFEKLYENDFEELIEWFRVEI